MLDSYVSGGQVHIRTPAGHELQSLVGKGKRRLIVCHRCQERLYISESLSLDDAAAELARLVEAHGAPEGCP
jgi:hypothetical protein